MLLFILVKFDLGSLIGIFDLGSLIGIFFCGAPILRYTKFTKLKWKFIHVSCDEISTTFINAHNISLEENTCPLASDSIFVGRCIQNIGSPSARVCSTFLESLSQTSDSRGRECAEDSC